MQKKIYVPTYYAEIQPFTLYYWIIIIDLVTRA